ncbi:MAG TPA: hypothetical protein VFS59_03995 [Gemmatimonadaceae bacterium]|nr:hypothetical protein [Gemmatimonadaceae bacterium]
MTRRTVIWTGVAALFTVVNLVGLGMAVAAGEELHSGVHVVLSVVGAVALWWLATGRRRPGSATADLSDARLEQLQQSIDAIALEVERIGEAQRFHAKLQAEQSESAR